MSENAPARMLDPICDMVVEVAEAKAAGRTVAYADRTYAFCSKGCLAAFNAGGLSNSPRPGLTNSPSHHPG